MSESTLRTLVKEEIQMVLNEDNIRNKIAERAKGKADGIYSADGVIYRVKNNTLTHYAKRGEILAVYGYFDTLVGNYRSSAEAKKMLKGVVD
jgi:hypothetical protein